MTLRPALYWVCSLLLTVGLALSGRAAAHAQAPIDPNDPHNPLRHLQFDTQVGVRIEPPAIPDQNSWMWGRFRGRLDAPLASPSAGIPQTVAQTRAYTPVAADEGAYLIVCYAATPDTLPRHCSPFIGPVKPAIPPSIEGLRWSAGSGLSDPHGLLAVNDEIQLRGGASGLTVGSQPFGTWWQRSPSNRRGVRPEDIETLAAFPNDIESFVYLSHPEQWANPDVQALPVEQGQAANRRYLTTDDVGRYVRGCWWGQRDTAPPWACTTWLGPVVATVHLPDEYRLGIVGVPSHVDVRGAAPVTWWRRPANDARRAPMQVAAAANPYTPAADDEGHYLRACQAVGADRACTRWLGPVLPPIPLVFGGDFPHVTLPGLDYFDRPNQRPTAYHVGDHLTAYIPPALQPIPLAPNGHASQPVWMVLMDGDDADHLQQPRHGHDRVLHVGPDFILPRQYQGQSFRVCLYGAHGEANTRGWGCSRRETIGQVIPW